MMSQKLPKKAPNRCNIEWNTHNSTEWGRLFSSIRCSNLLQSPDYGQAVARLNHQKIRRGVIVIDGKKAGLVQVLEAGLLGNAIHGVLLDRGPLWFEGYGSISDFSAFLEAFSTEFPKRFGRRLRFLPEIKKSEETIKLMHSHGFRKGASSGYQTIWMNLEPDEEDLRKGLNKKWRNTLKKAENEQLEVSWDDEHLQWLLDHYAADKAIRKFDGVSVKTAYALAREFSRGQNMLIGTALLDGQPIASILLLIHGSSATYQIGYTSEVGRHKCAHHYLFWKAFSELKRRNVSMLDLGGVNDGTAQGVKKFKEGMGGQLYETLGLYH